jgi:2-dehydropantoate 2-reductase
VAYPPGVKFRVFLEKRIADAEKVGHHKTSMLQDAEAARTLNTVHALTKGEIVVRSSTKI